MLFGRKRLPNDLLFQPKLNDTVLQYVESTKFFGVYIDNKLNWSVHVNYVSSNVSKAIGILTRIKNVVPSRILLTLYYTLVYPYLCYCNIIWACAGPTVLENMIVMQKRVVRIISHSSYNASTSAIFYRLHL